MRTNIKMALFLILALCIAASLFAQMSKHLDQFFNPKLPEVISAEQAKKHHVHKCEIFNKNGELLATFIYNAEGHIIMDNYLKSFYFYDGYGNINKIIDLNPDNSYFGEYNFSHADNGWVTSLSSRHATTQLGIESIFTFDHQDGQLNRINQTQLEDYYGLYKEQTTTSIDFYYKNDQLESIIYNSYDQNTINPYEVSHYRTSYFYENDRLVRHEEDDDASYTNTVIDKTVYYIYDEDGRLYRTRELSDSTAAIKYTPLYWFSYNDKGLVDSLSSLFKDKNKYYTYEYTKPAKVIIQAPDQLKQISIWNYTCNSDYHAKDIVDNMAIIRAYPHDKEMYLIKLRDDFVLPMILSPGTTTQISVMNGITFGKDDFENNMIIAIENEIQKVRSIMSEEGLKKHISNFIMTQLRSYPDLMAYLFYFDYWDLVNKKGTYTSYLKRIILKYPLNFRALDRLDYIEKLN